MSDEENDDLLNGEDSNSTGEEDVGDSDEVINFDGFFFF